MNSPDTSNKTSPKSSTRFWNRLQMILIFVVFAAPIIAAFFYEPDSFNNYGDIFTPVRPVSNLTMQSNDGPVELDSLRRQWVFLITAQDNCTEACEKNILKMRQLRFMQNNNMTRIRTVFLHSGLEPAVAEDLAAKYSPVESYSVPRERYNEWTKVLKLKGVPAEANQDRVFVIDPAGNLMMSYPASADPNMMKKDIKRLLKASQIG